MIYVLDPEAFTILDSMVVPAPPAHLAVTGLYDVDYRIVVACRNGTICTLKRGWTEAKVLTMLETQVCVLSWSKLNRLYLKHSDEVITTDCISTNAKYH